MRKAHAFTTSAPHCGVSCDPRYHPVMVGPLTTPTGGEPLEVHGARIGVGLVAGAVVALVKYAGSDSEVAERIAAEDFSLVALFGKMVGYAIIPTILGGIGGWISDERKVHKIFWAAITAPVIIAAAAAHGEKKSSVPDALPVGKAGWNFHYFSPIGTAYGIEAQAAEQTLNSQNITRSSNPFIQGLHLFLGTSREPTRYRVVVHSVLDDKDKAEGVAKRLNRDFQLPATAVVGERKPGNPYWPVVLDGWTTYAEAKKMKDAVNGLNFGLDDKPYISVENR